MSDSDARKIAVPAAGPRKIVTAAGESEALAKFAEMAQQAPHQTITVSSPSRPRASLSDVTFQTFNLEDTTPADAAPRNSASDPSVFLGSGATSARLGVFTLLERIGRGGQGEVWRARQNTLMREVAVKCLLPPRKGRSEEEHLAEFLAEAHTAAELEHPNILPVHELGFDPKVGRPLLAMKLIRGRSWLKLLKEDDAKPIGERIARHLPILIAVCNAVAYAHASGIIHRDLKPAQVMVGEFGEVLLSDWGMAIRVGQPARKAKVLCSPFIADPDSASSPAGTPAYMAPEQTQSDTSRLGPWTDIFLLGGMLYEILTRTAPYSGEFCDNPLRAAQLGLVTDPVQRSGDANLPERLCRIAMRALAADPQARYPGVLDLQRDLQDFQSGAARIREGRELIDRVERDFSGIVEDNYDRLLEMEGAVNRGSGLAPEDPRATPLRGRILERAIRLAIRQGDLALGRTLMARQPALRSELEPVIAAEEVRLARERRTRKLAIGSSLALIVLSAILAIGYSVQRARVAEEVRRQAENARDQRLKSLDSARHFIARLKASAIDPFPGSLATQVRLVESSQSLYGRLTEELEAREALELDVEAKATFGTIFQRLGDLERAATAYQQALDKLEALASSVERQPGLEERRVDLLAELGVVNAARAETARAIENLSRAEELLTSLFEREPSPHTLHRRANTRIRLARATQQAGETATARKKLVEAIDDLLAAAAAPDDTAAAPVRFAEAATLLIEWDPAGDPAPIDRITEHLTARADPTRTSDLRDLAALLALRSRVAAKDEDKPAAVEYARRSTQLWHALLDSGEATFDDRLAFVRLSLGLVRLHAQATESAEARTAAEGALGQLGALAGIRPGDPGLASIREEVFLLLARACADLRDARAALEYAQQFLDEAAAGDPEHAIEAHLDALELLQPMGADVPESERRRIAREGLDILIDWVPEDSAALDRRLALDRELRNWLAEIGREAPPTP